LPYRVLFFERDANGRTLTERWEAEGWAGLNNVTGLTPRPDGRV
jgi:hypothetical protein